MYIVTQYLPKLGRHGCALIYHTLQDAGRNAAYIRAHGGTCSMFYAVVID